MAADRRPGGLKARPCGRDQRPNRMARLLAAVLLLSVAAPQPPSNPPLSFHTALFRLQADEFWLNLHHFLYVLGRSAAKMSDASRDAVVHAPEESTRGLATLDEADKKAWLTAMAFYAAGPSRKDAVSDERMVSIALALAAAGDAVTLPNAAVDDDLRSILQNAASAYRKAWWPAHHAANLAWRDETQMLLTRHAAPILAFVTHAYQMPWDPDGYPVHISGYANWAGGYSTDGPLVVISSLDRASHGLNGLETVFHEGMHQWDRAVNDLLNAEAQRSNTRIPPGVSHALIFFTAGEAMRRIAPDHTPVAEAFGVWGRGMARLRTVMQDAWKPYLDGQGTRDEAIAALVARLKN
jgi:hypothetical protein